jgi:hypothetical protein
MLAGRKTTRRGSMIKRRILWMAGLVTIGAVGVFALVAVNLGGVSVAEASGKDKNDKKSGEYKEKGGPNLFWD